MRSQVIVDFLNEKITVEGLLYRLKVITRVLKNEEISDWINREISGYKKDEDVPYYRKITLEPKISGTDGAWELKNLDAPLYHLTEDEKSKICDYSLKECIRILERSVKENKPLYMNYNEKVRFLFSKGYDREINIYNAYSEISLPFTESVITNVKNKLLDIFLELEARFGNLDQYDILDELDINNQKEITKVILNYINIGDNNEINNSAMGVELDGEKNSK